MLAMEKHVHDVSVQTSFLIYFVADFFVSFDIIYLPKWDIMHEMSWSSSKIFCNSDYKFECVYLMYSGL